MADTEQVASNEAKVVVTETDGDVADPVAAAAATPSPVVADVAEPAQAETSVTYWVTNNTGAPLPVKLRNASGEEEFLHVAGRKRVKVPQGYRVDHNFSVLNKLKMNITSENN